MKIRTARDLSASSLFNEEHDTHSNVTVNNQRKTEHSVNKRVLASGRYDRRCGDRHQGRAEESLACALRAAVFAWNLAH